MHSENCPVNIRDGSETPSVQSMVNSSILEDDLVLSSSLQIADKTNEESESSKFIFYEPEPSKVVYLNEETMDCTYAETTTTPKKNSKDLNNEVSSPELFQSDDEELDSTKTSSRAFKRILSQQHISTQEIKPPKKITQEELVLQSDNYLLIKIHKSLTGVPPPPKLTICQRDCSDFLTYIKQNKKYFWADPLADNNNKSSSNEDTVFTDNILSINCKITDKASSSRAKSLRNLTTAFDACDQSNSSASIMTTRPEGSSDGNFSHSSSRLTINTETTTSVETNGKESTITDSELSLNSSASTNSASISTEISSSCKDNWKKRVTFNVPKQENLAIFHTVDEIQAKSLVWPTVYKHKAQGIHYNRNKFIEEFENLTTKLISRYIGNETQSTCTWFSKQAPNSAKKRSLPGKRTIGQSPGKRLSHLARRRKTFSSANLQGMAEKKQLVLNLKKPLMFKRGKSPRGKSPRGKSPRGKSPRSSTKKRMCRRLLMDGASPCKSKLETSRRALFQSPTSSLDRAGPSKIIQMSTLNSDPHKIRRALFPTPTKNNEESRKRKSEEELEGSRIKKPKSLSFDCSYNLDSLKERSVYSTASALKRSESLSQPIKTELSEVNRKKLLWAVHEALRSRGISMSHPKFKQYAVELARTVRRCMPDLENKNAPKKPGSTSDRMLKLAKHHVILIVETKCE